jgi:hypothetical protein
MVYYWMEEEFKDAGRFSLLSRVSSYLNDLGSPSFLHCADVWGACGVQRTLREYGLEIVGHAGDGWSYRRYSALTVDVTSCAEVIYHGQS